MDAPALPCKAGNFDDVIFCHCVLFQVHSFWGVDYAPVLKLEFYLYYGFCFSFVCFFSGQRYSLMVEHLSTALDSIP